MASKPPKDEEMQSVLVCHLSTVLMGSCAYTTPGVVFVLFFSFILNNGGGTERVHQLVVTS